MTEDGRLDGPTRRLAAVVVIGALMSILDTTSVNVALQSISAELGSPIEDVQWVASAYLLAVATVIPLTGWAVERVGMKRLWMTTVTLFVVFSTLCSFAWSLEALVAFRVLEGLASGMVMPIGMIALAQAVGPDRVARVMSLLGIPILLAPTLGPVLGGALLETTGTWRAVFLVNVPFGAIGLLLAWRLLPATRPARDAAGRLDAVGLALLSPGLALFVFGLSEVATSGEVAGWPLLVSAAGAALVVAFGVRGLRVERPLVDVGLLRGGGFAAATLTIACVGAALFGALLLLPLYFQLARGASAFEAGLLMAPQGLGAAAGMFLAGRLVDRVGGGRVVLIGLTLLAAGTLPFTQVRADSALWSLDAALLLRGVGLGFTMMPAMAAAYATLRREQVPRATPMLNAVQRVGGSVGTALLAVVLHEQVVRSGPTPEAFGHAYWWAVGVAVVAMVPAAMLARSERRRAPAAAAPAPA